MKKTRALILFFSAIAFLASVASLYVHYRLITDTSYTSFCDISESVSCEAVYESEYGTIAGVPVAAGGAIWAALVLLLAWRGMRNPRSETAAHVAEYVFVLSVVGLAAVLYLGYASVFVLDTICVLCVATYVGVFGVFFVAAGATTMPFSTLPARLGRDLRALTGSPSAVMLALVWVAASAAVIVLFPREEVMAVADASTETAPVTTPSETPVATAESAEGSLTVGQRRDFERWFQAQPYVALNVASGGAKVLVVKFNDYLCPPCRQTFLQYKPILDKFERTHPGQVRFVTKDFPLEPECNSGGGHLAACEAAAAVRMARVNNRAEALETWLFDNQPAMTPDLVRMGVRQVGGVNDFDAQYPRVLQQVRTDASYGQSIGVARTPTFFINGRKVEGGIEPQHFEAAIAYELARTASQP